MGIKELIEKLTEAEREAIREANKDFFEERCQEEAQRRALIAVWNRDKAQLLAAYRRLESSGSLDIMKEAAEFMHRSEIIIDPEIRDEIGFDPNNVERVSAHFIFFGTPRGESWRPGPGEVSGPSVTEVFWVGISASLDFDDLEISVHRKKTFGAFTREEMHEPGQEKLFEAKLNNSEWQNREKLEEAIAEALFKTGVRLLEREE